MDNKLQNCLDYVESLPTYQASYQDLFTDRVGAFCFFSGLLLSILVIYLLLSIWEKTFGSSVESSIFFTVVLILVFVGLGGTIITTVNLFDIYLYPVSEVANRIMNLCV